MKRKDKFTVVSIIVTIVCILVSIIFFFLVPNKISIQWSAAEPSNIVSKTYIFIMPIISVLTLSIGKKIFRFVVYKYFQRENEKFISYLNMYFNIVFLTCELYVIAYVYGVRLTISSIILAGGISNAQEPIIIGYATVIFIPTNAQSAIHGA